MADETSYLIGERGPELFVLRSPGRVIPIESWQDETDDQGGD